MGLVAGNCTGIPAVESGLGGEGLAGPPAGSQAGLAATAFATDPSGGGESFGAC